MQIIIAIVLLFAGSSAELPVIRSTQEMVTIRDGTTERKNGWRLSPEIDPDVYEAELIDGKPHEVVFITDVESIRFLVELGKSYDFVIDWNGKRCVQRIVGTRLVAPATFDAKYQSANRGSLKIEIPEAYELVNIALALTPTGIANKNLVYQQGDYYQRMRAWFDAHREHPFVVALEESLKRNPDNYNNLKMNAYTFVFDRRGKLVKRKEFDRTGWGRTNSLDPLLAQMQAFADATRFRKFFRANKATYDGQVAFYREQADVPGMLRWLDRNFPGAKPYDANRVVFSPLVAYNQSANWLESNGFRELHAHVNFAYEEDVRRYSRGVQLSKAGETVVRGNIAFTELNHGYINPEADKHAERILKAIAAREHWVDKAKGPGYYGGIAAFNEYMNWGLVSLRAIDVAPAEDQPKIIQAVEKMMTEGRGFPRFHEFNQALLALYRNRQPGQTLQDLYPRIIEWFEANGPAR